MKFWKLYILVWFVFLRLTWWFLINFDLQNYGSTCHVTIHSEGVRDSLYIYMNFNFKDGNNLKMSCKGMVFDRAKNTFWMFFYRLQSGNMLVKLSVLKCIFFWICFKFNCLLWPLSGTFASYILLQCFCLICIIVQNDLQNVCPLLHCN